MLVFTSPCLLLLAVLFQLHHVELLAQGSNGHSDTWKDTTLTKKLKSIISRGDMSELIDMVSDRSIVPPASMSRSADGKGPLFWAYEFGFTEAIKLLIEIGVDENTKDRYGKTPKEYMRSVLPSQEWKDTQITAALWTAISQHNRNTLIEILADTSIVPPPSTSRSADGRGPLFWAYEYNNMEAVKILESIGVDPNAKDKYGKTPRDLFTGFQTDGDTEEDEEDFDRYFNFEAEGDEEEDDDFFDEF